MISVGTAFWYTAVLALVIFACRAAPFVVFKNIQDESGSPGGSFTEKCIAFVEKTAPPVAITALAMNTLSL